MRFVISPENSYPPDYLNINIVYSRKLRYTCGIAKKAGKSRNTLFFISILFKSTYRVSFVKGRVA